MRFIVSDHALNKPLSAVNDSASKFISKTLMLKSIRLCIAEPDKKYIIKNRIHATKSFDFDIGLLVTCSSRQGNGLSVRNTQICRLNILCH